MKFKKSASWVLFGLALVSARAYALEETLPEETLTQPAVNSPTAKVIREKLLRDAEELMQAGKSSDAYELLEPLEFDYSGEVRFDYLIGIAALDSGKPDKATLAFERVMAVDPNFAGARLDLARAYFQLGDLTRAKTEFETVLSQNPPETARATIQKYLDAIAAQQTAKQTQFSAYAEAGLGYDNNVNNSTSQSQISVPYFNNAVFPLNPTSKKTADYYYSASAGGEVSHSLNANWGLYAGADLKQHGNFYQTRFDTLSMDGRAGVAFSTFGGKNIFRIGGMGGTYNLANIQNRSSYGYNADWRHVYSPTDQVSLFTQGGPVRFVDTDMKINNYDQTAYGAGWLHALPEMKSLLFGTVFRVAEVDVAPTSPTNPSGGRVDGNKLGLGMRAGGQTAIREDTELLVNLGMQSGDYNKTNPLFLRKRSDRLWDITVSANWHVDKDWTLRPQLSYYRNDSNIVIYRYDRMDVSLTVRRDFR